MNPNQTLKGNYECMYTTSDFQKKFFNLWKHVLKFKPDVFILLNPFKTLKYTIHPTYCTSTIRFASFGADIFSDLKNITLYIMLTMFYFCVWTVWSNTIFLHCNRICSTTWHVHALLFTYCLDQLTWPVYVIKLLQRMFAQN